MIKHNSDMTFSLKPFFFIALSAYLVLSLLKPEMIFAGEISSCKTSDNMKLKFTKQVLQISKMLSNVVGYKNLTADVDNIRCYRKIIDDPEATMVYEAAIKSKTDTHFIFSIGDKIRLNEDSLIKLNNSLSKFGKVNKVIKGQCKVSPEILAKMKEKSEPILVEMIRIYPSIHSNSYMSESPSESIQYYQASCQEYSTPEYTKFQIYMFTMGGEGYFDFFFDKNLELVSIYNSFSP